MRQIRKRVYFWSETDAHLFADAFRKPAESRHSKVERCEEMDEAGMECWSVVLVLNVNRPSYMTNAAKWR